MARFPRPKLEAPLKMQVACVERRTRSAFAAGGRGATVDATPHNPSLSPDAASQAVMRMWKPAGA